MRLVSIDRDDDDEWTLTDAQERWVDETLSRCRGFSEEQRAQLWVLLEPAREILAAWPESVDEPVEVGAAA